MSQTPDSEGPGQVRPWAGTVRWTFRILCLALAVAALWGSRTFLPVLVASCSPFVAVTAVLAADFLPVMAALGLLVAIGAMIRRRLFCRWACPTGVCTEIASLLGRRVGRRAPRWPAVGQGIALLTLGSAVFGYPILLWLDPLALFSGLFGVLGPEPRLATLVSALGIPALLLFSLLWPGLWCARVCPLGALQELLWQMPRSRRRSTANAPAGTRLGRRAVLATLAGLCCAVVTWPVRAARPRPLRPPGAVDEPRFVGLCLRCGNCIRACPSHIIAPEPGNHGWAGLLTPVLSFQKDYCREDCVQCTQVCPSGALASLALDHKGSRPLGWPQVDMRLCRLGNDEECSLCQSHCPYEAIRYVFSEKEDEYTLVPRVDLKRCPGCGACEAICPTQPAKAILIRPY